MEKVRLGRTDLMVSRLAFGGIPIQRLAEDDAITVINRCLSLGIDFIDTANAYTTSEVRIGKAINGNRGDLILATKTLARTASGVKDHLKLSLERMRTDYIDLYQLHDVSTPQAMEAILADNGPLAVALEAKKTGIIRHIGVTSHSLDMAIKLVKTDRFETIMFPLNFITHEAADELLPLTRKHDVGFIVMKPLAGGRLENVSLAFKYLLRFPDTVIAVGIEKTEEIEEIAKILAQPSAIGAAEEKEIARLREELGHRFCRRCDYCQPCPQGIPISFVLGYPSLYNRLPPERIFVEFVSGAMEKAALCTECGECEERCPYNLPVREILKGYVAEYQKGKAEYLASKSSG